MPHLNRTCEIEVSTMKFWKRKGMLRKAAVMKKRKVQLEPGISPADACSRGERHLRRHEYRKAYAYFRRAAGQGVSKAWGKLAVMYHRGLGCSADYENARFAIKAARIAARLEEYETSCHV